MKGTQVNMNDTQVLEREDLWEAGTATETKRTETKRLKKVDENES